VLSAEGAFASRLGMTGLAKAKQVQKVFNDVYRTFNVNQVPFIIADFLIPTGACIST
jgi:hypothetical protein